MTAFEGMKKNLQDVLRQVPQRNEPVAAAGRRETAVLSRGNKRKRTNSIHTPRKGMKTLPSRHV